MATIPGNLPNPRLSSTSTRQSQIVRPIETEQPTESLSLGPAPAPASQSVVKAAPVVTVTPSKVPGILSTLPVPLEERFHFSIKTPDLSFDSTPALRALDSLRPAQGTTTKLEPATDQQVEMVREALEQIPQKAFPQVSKWLRFELGEVDPAQPARKIADMVRDSIARPEEVASPLSRFLPGARPAVLTGAWVMKAARFIGVDFGLQRKGDRAAQAIEPDLKDFITQFEEVLPIMIGQLVTAVNMSKAQGIDLDLREVVPQWKPEEVASVVGLSLNPQQTKVLESQLKRSYNAFYSSVEAFMVKRKENGYESFAALSDALADDLPRAAQHVGRLMTSVQRRS